MTLRPDAPSIVAWVGLDWADQKHEVRLQTASSSHIEAFQLEQKPEVLQNWVADMRRRFPEGQIATALEQSRGAVLCSDELRLPGSVSRSTQVPALGHMPTMTKCGCATSRIAPPFVPWPSRGFALCIAVCWKNRAIYDGALYTQALQKRGSPLAIALVPPTREKALR